MISSLLSSPLETIYSLLLSLPGVLLAITLHESAHGWMAEKLGDPTAREAGRISMNPLRHMDPLGFLLLILARVGWAKPVPVNPRFFKKPKRGMRLTSLAGPVSNLLCAFVFMLLTLLCALFYSRNYENFGDTTFSSLLSVLTQVFQATVAVNIGLGVFNLLPLPPLDGWKILGSFLPEKLWFRLLRYERYGMLLLFALLFLGVLSEPVDTVITLLYNSYMNLGISLFSLFI